MEFRRPLPIIKKSTPSVASEIPGLHSFSKSILTDITLIRNGTFGSVYKGFRDGIPYVMMQLSNADSQNQRLLGKKQSYCQHLGDMKILLKFMVFVAMRCSLITRSLVSQY